MTRTKDKVTADPFVPLASVVIELGRLLERRINRALNERNVTAGQFIALVHLARCPGMSRAELAREIQVTPQAIGALAAQLLEKGLVSKVASGPGHPHAFTLTDDGCQLIDELMPAMECITEEMLRYFRPNLATAIDGALRHLLMRLS
jgi:DNA-binding MarR family transcriptional regulator